MVVPHRSRERILASRLGQAGLWGLVLVWVSLPTLAADAGPAPPDLAAAGGDPLELARRIERHGDGLVLEGLKASGRAQRLAAIRGAPHTARPVATLAPLCRILGSRDPELAPAAARAAAAVARRLHREGLARYDVLPSGLAAARATLKGALERDWLRPDIRNRALATAYFLDQLQVPAPAAPGEPN